MRKLFIFLLIACVWMGWSTAAYAPLVPVYEEEPAPPPPPEPQETALA